MRTLLWNFLANEQGGGRHRIRPVGSRHRGRHHRRGRGARHQPQYDVLDRLDVAEITGSRSAHVPKPVNDRSTSVRHHRGSVGVGCTMGHLPASERPRSCSLGTGPFVFSSVVLAALFELSSFICRINGLRERRAPTLVAATKSRSAPAEQMRAWRHPETRMMLLPVHSVARSFLCPHG